MLGRITKSKNLFNCIINDNIYPVELDSCKKINNGDLVKISDFSDKKIISIKSSQIEVLKRVSPGVSLFDINESTPLFKRLENRILDLRRPYNHAIFKIRSEIVKILMQIFNENDYINVNTPIIIGNATEGRVKTLNMDFFGEKVSLAMTKLLYLRYLICCDFKKIYDFSPVFVGGDIKTHNHISEYFTLDWATSEKKVFTDYLHFIDDVLLKLIYGISKIKTSRHYDKIFLAMQIKKAKIITYKNLVNEYLKNNPADTNIEKQLHIPGRVIEFGHKLFGEYMWVIEFPENFKQFYCDTIKRDEKVVVVVSSELWWNKIKVASVSFSNSDYNKTLNRLKLLGLNQKNFKTYLNAINIASPEAYLGSLYIERLMMAILNITSIKETVMFPRAASGALVDP